MISENRFFGRRFTSSSDSNYYWKVTKKEKAINSLILYRTLFNNYYLFEIFSKLILKSRTSAQFVKFNNNYCRSTE